MEPQPFRSQQAEYAMILQIPWALGSKLQVYLFALEQFQSIRLTLRIFLEKHRKPSLVLSTQIGLTAVEVF